MVSTKKQFQQLRLKLTVIYVIIGFFVIACFNFAVIWIFDYAGRGFKVSFAPPAKEQTVPIRIWIKNEKNEELTNHFWWHGSSAPESAQFSEECISGLGVSTRPGKNGEIEGYLFSDQYRLIFDQRLASFSKNFRQALFLFDSLIIFVIVLLGYYYSDYVLKPVERSLRKQEDFVLDASHELKTPIATILAEIAALRIITGCDLGNEVCSTLDVIESETKNLHHLSQSMLDLTKMNNEQPQLVRLDLSRLIENELKKFQSRATQKKIRFTAQIKPKLELLGDRHQLIQLLGILLDNALKYTPAQGSIGLRLTGVKKEIKLIVSDTGVGVRSIDHERIFERFYRAKNKATLDQDGSGLGLSIAQQIVDYHHGQIKVQSNPEQVTGTTFIITFHWLNPLPQARDNNTPPKKIS